jgi:pimeloyl-ACP methyl ester carboxylesterase
MDIVLIHGANASKISWNWVGSNLEKSTRLSWGMMVQPEKNLLALEAELPDKCIVVGHSMGGLYAWHLANRNPDRVIAGISVATPWGGSIQAGIWKMFNFNIPWLQMLTRHEPWTAQTRLLETPVPWTNVVCTHGFDLFGVGDNDGVVTVESQRELHGPAKEIVLDYGHNEVLQSPELLEIIKSY